MNDELSDEQLYDAAAGDLFVLTVLMFVGSTTFAILNLWIGTFGFTAAGVAILSAAMTSGALYQRNEMIAAVVKVSFGFSGLAAPLFGVAGIVFGLLGQSWGWAVLVGAILYFGLSLLGLEILERAEDTGVISDY